MNWPIGTSTRIQQADLLVWMPDVGSTIHIQAAGNKTYCGQDIKELAIADPKCCYLPRVASTVRYNDAATLRQQTKYWLQSSNCPECQRRAREELEAWIAQSKLPSYPATPLLYKKPGKVWKKINNHRTRVIITPPGVPQPYYAHLSPEEISRIEQKHREWGISLEA